MSGGKGGGQPPPAAPEPGKTLSANAPETAEGRHEERIFDLKKMYEESNNPLFVWEAIYVCRRRAEEIFRNDLSHLKKEDRWAIMRAQGFPPPVALPDWCLHYLGGVALQFGTLENGHDERCLPDNDGPEEQEAIRNWLNCPTLDPAAALTRVPAVMGLVRPGWNAFDRKSSSKFSEYLAEQYKRRLDDGYSSENAVTALAEQHQIDSRSIYRRIQIGNQFRKEIPESLQDALVADTDPMTKPNL